MYLAENNYNYQKAVDRAISIIFNTEAISIAYTCNPLILNYFDDEFAKNNLYFITEMGEHILMEKDIKMLKKLTCMGVGEVTADDERVFI
jgi:hypothetical protein